jgi:hypothetical protein
MRPLRCAIAVMAVSVVSFLGIGCEDDPATTEDNMVTIAGTVRNVDGGSIAADVHVRQWGTSHEDDVPTGTDGKFELEVPRGTKLALVTDDFNPAIDEWFPMINVDIVPIVANDDILDLPIHACPNIPPGPVGSLAIWERYLSDCDDTENGDLFQPTSIADAGGTVAILTLDCTFAGFDSISCDIGLAEAPIEYMNAAVFIPNPDGPAVSQCNIFHPESVNQMDAAGWAQGFFDTTLTASSVTITFTDNKASRGIQFPGPITVPIGKGVVSLMLVGIYDNKAVSFPTLAKECGFFP